MHLNTYWPEAAFQICATIRTLSLGRLLREHRLSMVDIEAARRAGSIAPEDRVSQFSRVPRWARCLMNGIASACCCQVILLPATNEATTVRFVGEQTEAAIAGYWYEVLEGVLPSLAKRDEAKVLEQHRLRRQLARLTGQRLRKASWRELRDDYLIGAAMRINERLQEKLTPAPDTSGDALRALLVVRRHAIDQWVALNHRSLVTVTSSRDSIDSAAAAIGYQAAGAITLADGIRASGPLRHLSGPLERCARAGRIIDH